MDTIFNLGLNEDVVEVIAKKSGNPRWACDCYRRFIQMYSDVVMEVGKKYFEQLIDKMKEEKGVTQDVDLTAEDLKTLAEQFKAEYKAKIGEDFPTDPKERDRCRQGRFPQLGQRPCERLPPRQRYPLLLGHRCQRPDDGVRQHGQHLRYRRGFTRNPATGEKVLTGEFLMNAQGEDVVAGVRTPQHIDQLKEVMPEVYEQFVGICNTLENHYHDMQDMEFTIEDKKLYMLQTRNGKRTPAAALKIACDLIDEGMIDEKQAVLMIDPRNLDALLHPTFDTAALKAATPAAKALAASPGAACGKVVFTAEDAKEWKARGEKVVLVRLETSPEDIEGMKASEGILTVRGGMTSHAAVVPAAWASAASPAARPSRWTKRTRSLNWPARPTTKAIISPSTVPPATSTTASSRPSPRPSAPATSAASCRWLTSTARWLSAPTRIPPERDRRKEIRR